MEVTKNNLLIETRSIATVSMFGSQWGQKKLEWRLTTLIFVQNVRCVQWLLLLCHMGWIFSKQVVTDHGC